MLEHIIPTKRAILVWRNYNFWTNDSIVSVGQLIQKDDHVLFQYFHPEDDSPGKRILGLHQNDKGSMDILGYGRRILSEKRGDYASFMEQWGFYPEKEYSELTILAYTGGKQLSDPFFVCETFDGFEPPFSFIFDTIRPNKRNRQNESLKFGDSLIMTKESRSRVGFRKDPYLSPLGYVNPIQERTVGDWINKYKIESTVWRFNFNPYIDRLFVKVEIKA